MLYMFLHAFNALATGRLQAHVDLGYQLARRRRTTTLGTLDHFRHFELVAYA